MRIFNFQSKCPVNLTIPCKTGKSNSKTTSTIRVLAPDSIRSRTICGTQISKPIFPRSKKRRSTIKESQLSWCKLHHSKKDHLIQWRHGPMTSKNIWKEMVQNLLVILNLLIFGTLIAWRISISSNKIRRSGRRDAHT